MSYLRKKNNYRIRLVYFEHSPTMGGAERYLISLLNGLSPDNYDIVCICTNASILEQLKRQINTNEVHFVFYEMSQPSIWKTVWPLSRLIASMKPDIVHCNGIDGYGHSSYFILASRLARVPVVMGIFHTPMMQYPKHTLTEKLFGYLIDQLIDAGILISKNSLEPVLNGRHLKSTCLHQIYNGVPIQEFTRASESRTNPIVIGTVTRLVECKDVATFLTAASIVIHQMNYVRFVIFGDGPEKKVLIEQADRLGITGNVIFAGWQEDVKSALQSVDIFVLNSINEGFGLAIVEAMACELPVIATRVGGIPEIVEEGMTGLLVPPQDPNALAEAICYLIERPQLVRSFGVKGRQRAQTLFSADTMVKQTSLLYQKLLSHKIRFLK